MNFYTNVYYSGDTIYYRGIENGIPIKYKTEDFKPSLFVPTNKKSKWKNIYGSPLEEVNPGSIKDCREFLKMYENVEGYEIYGNTSWIHQYITHLFPSDVEYNINLINIGYLDIEVESENGFSTVEDVSERINVITLKTNNKTYTLGLGEYKLEDIENIEYYCFDDEKEMIIKFIEIWNKESIDVVTGWNIRFFDIPYLMNRIYKLFDKKTAKCLSPWNLVSSDEIVYRGKNCEVFKLHGISILDYYELYRKYTYQNQESYALNHIAYVELGKKKIDYTEYTSIREFYQKNFQKFVEYNIVDVNLVNELNDKLNLLELHIYMSYMSKSNYEDVMGQVKMWDCIIYNHLHNKNIVIPMKHIEEKDTQFAGAFVKDPQIGFHNWVVSLDLSSLYPSLIMQYNISPETIIDNPDINIKYTVDDLLNKNVDTSIAKSKNYSMVANMQYYRKDMHGFLPELMKKVYTDRKTQKKKMIEKQKELQLIVEEIEKRGLKK